MSLYATAVKKPVTTALVFVAIVIFGLFSLTRLSVDLLPRDRDKHDHGHDLLCRRQRCGYRNERLQTVGERAEQCQRPETHHVTVT